MQSLFSIFSLDQAQYADSIFARLQKGHRHASLLYSDWYRQGQVSSAAHWIEPQAKALVEELIALTDFTLPELSFSKKEGDVVKFLLRFSDGLESESVIIPMKFGNTLCISSQVGCKMGCAFCETGKMGLIRHLSVEEIVSQVFVAKFHMKSPVRNIVFMGMGEPFDNFDAVMQAVRVLVCETGFGIAPSRITISTSGRVDGIYRLIEEGNLRVNLALSLNAPNDLVRNRLMPVNRKWDLQELKKAMEAYCMQAKRSILIEYVMIDGINDSEESAREVAAFLQGLDVKINLIPYNPQRRDLFAASSEENIARFREILSEEGYFTLIRGTKGQSIMAACGQLGNREMRKRMISI